MKHTTMILVVLLALWASSTRATDLSKDVPEHWMVITMQASAADCRQANLSMAHETRNDDSQTTFTRSLARARACVDNAKTKGRAEYAKALNAAPESRPLLAPVYARWLGYIESMTAYFNEEAWRVEEAKFDAAVNDMLAELEARAIQGAP